MISPRYQRVIQIDVTNACPRRCSNCTRFCGHHRKPFFMDMPTFRQAVDSLDGYPGMAGMMGGEPTIHPEFAAMTEYLAFMRPDPPPDHHAYAAIGNLAEYRRRHLSSMHWRKGLWSGLGPGYERHYASIMRHYRYQCINDHHRPGQHIALLIDRREIGVPDDEWVKLRDDCWIQREWSASITPKGAYFCEVAAARAMLFGGPDGWPVEPGWWERTPADFGAQLELCEGCSACLPVASLPTDIETDLVTPRQAETLRALGSGKKMIVARPAWDLLRQKRANQSPEPYIDAAEDRAAVTTHKRHITGLVVCSGYEDYLRVALPRNVREVDAMVVVTRKGECTWCESVGASVIETNAFDSMNGGPFAKGAAIAVALACLRKSGAKWILVHDADVLLPVNLRETLARYWLNPDALYFARRVGPRAVSDIPAAVEAYDSRDWDRMQAMIETRKVGHDKAKARKAAINPIEASPYGYFQLFNLDSMALRNQVLPYPHDSKTAEHDDREMAFAWYGNDKCHQLPIDVLHMPHGAWQANWRGRVTPSIEEA